MTADDAPEVGLTEAVTACPACGHQHTNNGCSGPPTPSDLWAGVSPAVCDCDPQDALNDTDAMRSCSCPSCNHYAPDYEEHKDKRCETWALIDQYADARTTEALDAAKAEAAQQALLDAADEWERGDLGYPERAGRATAPGCPAAADRSFWLRAAVEVAALGDPTHGSNHAPLAAGVLLDPGYCDGCDLAREAGQS